MLDKINLLSLTAVSIDSVADEAAKAAAAKEKAACVLILLAIIAVCMAVSFLEPKIKEAFSSKETGKAEAKKQAELDRLHRIKKKNKRK